MAHDDDDNCTFCMSNEPPCPTKGWYMQQVRSEQGEGESFCHNGSLSFRPHARKVVDDKKKSIFKEGVKSGPFCTCNVDVTYAR
jgi:hypothetical protein